MKTYRALAALLTAAMLTSCSSGGSEYSSSSAVTTAPAVTATETNTRETTTVTTVTTFKTTAGSSTASETVTTPTVTEADNGYDISGITAALPDISVSLDGDRILQTGTSNGIQYSLTVDLTSWSGGTSPEQITTLSELFWECYPRMFAHFGQISNAPTDVTLAIEDFGYSPAECSGNFVHIHDEWLSSYPTDYDCITHELAHVIQNGWNGEALEYSDYIERFADFCRYEYAFRNGFYNDSCWTLWSADYEDTIEKSNRFFVWLDYTYSAPENDIMLDFFRVCFEQKYASDQWDAAWQEIFSGSALEGRTIDDVWNEFISSDFAYLSADRTKGTSELLSRYDVRGKLT